jgi:hypothetical protein
MEDKFTQFQETIKSVLDTIDKQTLSSPPLLILNDENDIADVLLELDTQLQEKGLLDKDSESKPYHFVQIGYDGDMLDGLLDIYMSSNANYHNDPASVWPTLGLKDHKFHHLVKMLTKDKFIVFHITEYDHRLFFEMANYPENENIMDFSFIHDQYDELIRRFFNYSTTGRLDETRMNRALQYLRTHFSLKLSNAFLVLPFIAQKNLALKYLVLMNWRTFVLLNTFRRQIWGQSTFQIYDLSESGLSLIPGKALQQFLLSLNLPEDLPAWIIQNCERSYPRRKPDRFEGSRLIFQPKWREYWLEQMHTFKVPSLVEGKLHNMCLQAGMPSESINNLIQELKGYSPSAIQETEGILLRLDVAGEVIEFILDIMNRCFGWAASKRSA